MSDILREIGMIARALDSISNIEFKELDLTKGQYLYLVRVCEHPGIIQEKLAEMLKVDRTTAARAVQKLELQGFVTRRGDADNKKIKRIYPTERGEQAYPFLKREGEHSCAVALSGIADEEAERLLALLKQVRRNIEADWEVVKKGGKRIY